MTYADVFRPAERTLLYDALLVLFGAVLIAVLARLTFYLPNSVVPITGQTLGVLLIGALYGSRRGMVSVIAYIGYGVAGLPVFAGGLSGPAVLLGPTGGFLVGFVAAAYVVGLLAERGFDRKLWTTALAMVAGTAIIYAFGVGWLSTLLGPAEAVRQGMLPFLPGDLLKLVVAALLLPSGWKFLPHFEEGRTL